jgi:hypothetical protein
MSTNQTQPMLRPRAGGADLFGTPAYPSTAGFQGGIPRGESGGGKPQPGPEFVPPRGPAANLHETFEKPTPAEVPMRTSLGGAGDFCPPDTGARPLLEQYKWVVIGLIAIIVALMLLWYFFFKQPTDGGGEDLPEASEEEEQRNAQMRAAIARRQEMERERRVATLEPHEEDSTDDEEEERERPIENSKAEPDSDASGDTGTDSDTASEDGEPAVAEHDSETPPDASAAKTVRFTKPAARAKSKRILRGGRRK